MARLPAHPHDLTMDTLNFELATRVLIRILIAGGAVVALVIIAILWKGQRRC